MKLEGIHHISAITENGQRNVDFYVGTMGLRLVKKTVNQDAPTVYHLFFADEGGSPGSDLTFFEYPGASPGRAGAGMVHRIVWRVGSIEAIEFWATRLGELGLDTRADEGGLVFTDPEGLDHELRVSDTDDPPLTARHPEIPEKFALQGFEGVRAYSAVPDASERILESLEFERQEDAGRWEARGEGRGGWIAYDKPPEQRGVQGAGSVHHVAWASRLDEIDAWRERAAASSAQPTPIIDRFYFAAVYFREPSGVLFEISTLGPGFTVDEPLESLGEKLSLPPDFEHLRSQVEPNLRPIVNPRLSWEE